MTPLDGTDAAVVLDEVRREIASWERGDGLVEPETARQLAAAREVTWRDARDAGFNPEGEAFGRMWLVGATALQHLLRAQGRSEIESSIIAAQFWALGIAPAAGDG